MLFWTCFKFLKMCGNVFSEALRFILCIPIVFVVLWLKTFAVLKRLTNLCREFCRTTMVGGNSTVLLWLSRSSLCRWSCRLFRCRKACRAATPVWTFAMSLRLVARPCRRFNIQFMISYENVAEKDREMSWTKCGKKSSRQMWNIVKSEAVKLYNHICDFMRSAFVMFYPVLWLGWNSDYCEFCIGANATNFDFVLLQPLACVSPLYNGRRTIWST